MVAIGLCLLLGVLRIVFGSNYGSDLPFSMIQIGGIYLVSIPLAGAVVGALWPWTDSQVGRFIVGSLAMVPVSLAIALPMVPMTDATVGEALFGAGVSALLLGGIGGLVVFEPKGREG